MSTTMVSLSRKISGAKDLQSVVRTMKALAASSMGQYEQSVKALTDYARTVELGLRVCFGEAPQMTLMREQKKHTPARGIGAVVFGSDQGLVGQFNEVIADYAVKTLAPSPGHHKIWAVGERVKTHLAEANFEIAGLFPVPNSIKAITPLVTAILLASETFWNRTEIAELHLFYHRPTSRGVHSPVNQRLLPLDDRWRNEVAARAWPTGNLPEIIGRTTATVRPLIREHLFISLFRACAESLASENVSRLTAMQRAEKNIDELLENLNRHFHHMRQRGIDEELFDVLSGFEALTKNPVTSDRNLDKS